MPNPVRIGLLVSMIWLGAHRSDAPAQIEPAPSALSDRWPALLAQAVAAGVQPRPIGVTRAGTALESLVAEASPWPHGMTAGDDPRRFRLVLVAGPCGDTTAGRALMDSAVWFASTPQGRARAAAFDLAWVPLPDPDHDPDQEGDPVVPAYPPDGAAYQEEPHDRAHYLWRWIGMHGADLVIEVQVEKGIGTAVGLPEDALPTARALAAALDSPGERPGPGSLAAALNREAPAGVAPVPALRLTLNADTPAERWLEGLLAAIESLPIEAGAASPARTELEGRLARSPMELAGQLATVYGNRLESTSYIPATAVIGRIRYARLAGDEALERETVALADPYRNGDRPNLGQGANGSHLAGHLLFAKLARIGSHDDGRDLELVRVAAAYGFDEQGEPLPSMPFHNEMSDSVYMGCAILAAAGELTAEARYFEQALRHLEFIQGHCLRDDGLYRHSPLDESAWGRGNGFASLGLALSLASMPADAPGRNEFLASYRQLMGALRDHQHADGAWHQVIDRPESYRELSATCMITFALVKGLRHGWIEGEAWEQVAERGWRAILLRTAADGRLVDVCTGTGKQRSLRDYYDRAAILGRDERGGAMALLVATEVENWRRLQNQP